MRSFLCLHLIPVFGDTTLPLEEEPINISENDTFEKIPQGYSIISSCAKYSDPSYGILMPEEGGNKLPVAVCDGNVFGPVIGETFTGNDKPCSVKSLSELEEFC